MNASRNIKSFLFLLLFGMCSNVVNAQNIISTAFGTGVLGYAGDSGQARNAEFNVPYGIYVSPSSNIYITDWYNGRIRKIDALGIVTTVGGNGIAGSPRGDGGPAVDANIIAPEDVYVDRYENIYFTEATMNCIRRIDGKTGIITTIAGLTIGSMGYSGDGGPAVKAAINGPKGICMDTTGNIFFADAFNNVIRKIDTAGIITTVLSESNPYPLCGICVDDSDNLYIGDDNGYVVQKYTAATGVLSTIAGNGTSGYSGDGGPAINAQLEPKNLFLDGAGNLYVVDYVGRALRKIDLSTGIINTVAGNGISGYSGDGGPATNAEIHRVWGACMDKKGNIFIADDDDGVVREVHKNATISGFITRDTDISPIFSYYKVLLIKYDSSTGIISSVDSTYTNGKNTAYYIFGDEPSGNYLVKAIITNNDTSGIGYVPTYSDSSIHWDSASYVSYAVGTPSSANIAMQRGTLTSGPGFVSGSVLVGAGKVAGSSGKVGDPVSGLLVYLEDANGKLIKYVNTDTDGNYSFDDIPIGNYIVFPEEIGYKTIPYVITITGTSLTIKDINFKKTSSYIEPSSTVVETVNDDYSRILVSPNPSKGIFHIQLHGLTVPIISVAVTNLLGQEVYQTKINTANSQTDLDLSKLTSGNYFINFFEHSINQVQMITIQH